MLLYPCGHSTPTLCCIASEVTLKEENSEVSNQPYECYCTKLDIVLVDE